MQTLFDRADFAERLGDDPDLATEIIDLFIDVQPQRMNDLAHAVARDDLRAMRACAHLLAGAFASMSMEPLRAAAVRLEHAAGACDVDACRALFLDLDQLFAEVMAELNDEPLSYEVLELQVLESCAVEVAINA